MPLQMDTMTNAACIITLPIFNLSEALADALNFRYAISIFCSEAQLPCSSPSLLEIHKVKPIYLEGTGVIAAQ